MQFNIRDLIFLITCFALSIAWWTSRDQLADMKVTTTRLERRQERLQSQTKHQADELALLKSNENALTIQLGQLAKENQILRSDYRAKATDQFVFRSLELMERKRYPEAAASLEIAIRNHPRNILFLEKLVECHRYDANFAEIERCQKRLNDAIVSLKLSKAENMPSGATILNHLQNFQPGIEFR